MAARAFDAVAPLTLRQWAAREGIDAGMLALHLKVDPDLLERIERGEVVPGDELVERLWVLTSGQATFDLIPIRRDPSPGSERAGQGAAASSSLAAAAPVSCEPGPTGADLGAGQQPASRTPPPPTCMGWLARRDGGGWFIEAWLQGYRYHQFSIDEARDLVAELGELVAVHDATPAGFARQCPVDRVAA